jgi:hypothetical protein
LPVLRVFSCRLDELYLGDLTAACVGVDRDARLSA